MTRWIGATDRPLTLPLFVGGFFGGVALLSLYPLGISFPLLCALLALVLLALTRSSFSRRVFVVLIACSLGALWMGLADARMPRAADIEEYVGRRLTIEGTIVSDPEHRGVTRRAKLSVKRLGGDTVERVHVLAVFDAAERVSYGDTLALSGILTLPDAFETDNGRTFDYAHYLRKDGMTALLRNPTTLSQKPAPRSLRGALFSLKHVFQRNSESVYPEPQGGLLKGMLLGENDALPADLQDVFIQAGLVHIVVLSGYNVSLVADALMKTVSFLPRAGMLAVGSVSIVLFVAMVGAPATAVRAGIMALLIVLTRALRRPQALLRALLCAGLVMVAWNPFILVYDPSFQLSFLATLGLILFGSALETKLLFFPEHLHFRAIAAATLATQIMVLPALLYMSGVVSLVSLPANLLALVAVPFSMFFGFFGALFAALPLLSFLPATAATLLLSYVIAIAKFATALPGSSFLVREFPLWLVFLLYGLIAFGAFALYTKRRRARPGEHGLTLVADR